jgi:hypothetical protein
VHRLSLAAIVLAAALIAGVRPMASASLPPGDDERTALTPPAPQSCTDTERGGGWNPQRDAAASTTESAWRWRSLHAAFAAVPPPAGFVAIRTTDSPGPRAPAAPAHLLHTPLLI